jgi:hypothetical protein
MVRIRKWMRAFRGSWLRFLDARISIVPVVLGLLLLIVPQGNDVVRDLAESSNVYLQPGASPFSPAAWWTYLRWFCFIFACLWTGITAWYWPLLLTRSRVRSRAPTREGDWFTWLRRALGMAPILAALVALWTVGDRLQDIWIGLAACALVAGALIVFFVYRDEILDRWFRNAWFRRPSIVMQPLFIRFGGRAGERLTLGEDLFVLATFFASLIYLLLFSLPGIRTIFATAIGSAAIAFSAVGSMIAIISAIVWLLSGSRLPALTLGLVALLGFSLLNDNHGLEPVPSDLVTQRPSIDDAYGRWLATHPTGPVILVATAGGASRAGYWTAAVLRGLDDRSFGRFGRQAFAISSVSGGSLAAIGYAGWVADHPDSPDCPYSREARLAFDQKMYGADYLSPALGGLLYPDLIQRFLPFPLFQDRAASLEEGFEQGWQAATDGQDACRGSARMKGDFLEIWRGALHRQGGWVPLVFANGTLVENGKRVITAPVKIEAGVFEDSYDFFGLMGDRSVSASTAVMNSARFPLVSPAASLGIPDGKIHIVDGGYFENGGLETLYDIARAIRASAREQRPIIIVEINNEDKGDDRYQSEFDGARYPNNRSALQATRMALPVARPKPNIGRPGLIAIGQGLLMTRTSRGVLAAKRLSSLKAVGIDGAYRASFNLAPLPDGQQTAMSWYLSLGSRRAIDHALVDPDWLPQAEREAALRDQHRFDWWVDCQRAAADEIAAALGPSTGARDEPRCLRDKPRSQWVGVPMGLSAGALAPPAQAIGPRPVARRAATAP